MDLDSAVQFLLAYEASLKLAPGQKPPLPSPSLFVQLSAAVAAIAREMKSKKPDLQFSGLSPSVWSDWPLCCGVDLTPKELRAARSLPPPVLRERGIMSLFLALQSCAFAKVKAAACLAPDLLVSARVLSPAEADPAPFPSAHLAARVGHRLINADDTLDFQANLYGDRAFAMWSKCTSLPDTVLIRANAKPNRSIPALPHEAAGLSLAEETAVMLDALCAAQRGPRGSEVDGAARGRGVSNRLLVLLGCKIIIWLEVLLTGTERTPIGRSLQDDVYREVAMLPSYDPVLLLESLDRSIDSGSDARESMQYSQLSDLVEGSRLLLWKPLVHPGPLGKLKPADGYTAMRLALEALGRPLESGDARWLSSSTCFAIRALHSGMVRPELILRARPQLLEELVEGLASGRVQKPEIQLHLIPFLTLLTFSPAVSFHLRKFFSRSGCLQASQAVLEAALPTDCRRALIRLLGPRAAQSDSRRPSFWGLTSLLQHVTAARTNLKKVAKTGSNMDILFPTSICDSIIRGQMLDILREPSHAQSILQYLSELTEEIAAPKRPDAPYGVLMVVGLGKACLALSSTVARALQDIREEGRRANVLKEPGEVGARGKGTEGQRWRGRLFEMRKELSLLRRRVLHELLPLAEAREAALWEGVREEEVVAALRGDA